MIHFVVIWCYPSSPGLKVELTHPPKREKAGDPLSPDFRQVTVMDSVGGDMGREGTTRGIRVVCQSWRTRSKAWGCRNPSHTRWSVRYTMITTDLSFETSNASSLRPSCHSDLKTSYTSRLSSGCHTDLKTSPYTSILRQCLICMMKNYCGYFGFNLELFEHIHVNCSQID